LLLRRVKLTRAMQDATEVVVYGRFLMLVVDVPENGDRLLRDVDRHVHITHVGTHLGKVVKDLADQALMSERSTDCQRAIETAQCIVVLAKHSVNSGQVARSCRLRRLVA
jgi:hypothetical protein